MTTKLKSLLDKITQGLCASHPPCVTCVTATETILLSFISVMTEKENVQQLGMIVANKLGQNTPGTVLPTWDQLSEQMKEASAKVATLFLTETVGMILQSDMAAYPEKDECDGVHTPEGSPVIH